MSVNQKNNDNTIEAKTNYIKINHKNKIEDLKETEYYNELMNLANTIQTEEQNIGVEINKFFQYILPENKEGDLLLFDEPTGALDEASGINILELIKELHVEGKTIILVTHTKEIGLISDRIVTLKDGKIISNKENNNPIPVKEVHW